MQTTRRVKRLGISMNPALYHARLRSASSSHCAILSSFAA